MKGTNIALDKLKSTEQRIHWLAEKRPALKFKRVFLQVWPGAVTASTPGQICDQSDNVWTQRKLDSLMRVLRENVRLTETGVSVRSGYSDNLMLGHGKRQTDCEERICG